MEDIPGCVEHLFRHEAGKMVSYLTRFFGLGRLNLAEDVVQDVLCQALQTWPTHGLPDNPSAWLMRAARNRAIDLVRRDDRLRHLTPELTHLLRLREESPEREPAFKNEIQDDQLRMMFACCHPGLSSEIQITLILKTLCGFSVAEIASALLAGEDSVEKRLGRARRFFRETSSAADAPEIDLSSVSERLDTVHQAIYLLFNEGYHSSRSEAPVRDDLCYEALRLALLLSEHPRSAQPATFALVALFCFNAARLPGRLDAEGSLLQLEDQDRSKWDRALIGKGFDFLEESAAKNEVSEFHLEAAIASMHSSAETYEKTDWSRIQQLYNLLYSIKPTPIVALNRAIAVGEARGPREGLAALQAIHPPPKLRDYPFYPAAQAEFLFRAGRREEARSSFKLALNLARNEAEARFLQRKLQACA